MVQLVNGNGTHASSACATDDCIPPILDIELELSLPSRPTALILQPEGKALDFEYKEGKASLSVDRVDIHSIIEVCI
jgi:hypothetical protein